MLKFQSQSVMKLTMKPEKNNYNFVKELKAVHKNSFFFEIYLKCTNTPTIFTCLNVNQTEIVKIILTEKTSVI